jgi:hypothetical protein
MRPDSNPNTDFNANSDPDADRSSESDSNAYPNADSSSWALKFEQARIPGWSAAKP